MRPGWRASPSARRQAAAPLFHGAGSGGLKIRMHATLRGLFATGGASRVTLPCGPSGSAHVQGQLFRGEFERGGDTPVHEEVAAGDERTFRSHQYTMLPTSSEVPARTTGQSSIIRR